jgi:hypothetical protein
MARFAAVRANCPCTTSRCYAAALSAGESGGSSSNSGIELPEPVIALQDVLGLRMAVIVSPAGYGRDMATC